MNILYVANDHAMFGANKSMIDLIVPMKNRGHKITVLIYKHCDLTRELDKQNISYFVIPYKLAAYREEILPLSRWQYLAYNVNVALKMKQFMNENDFDIIHSNASNVDFGALLATIYKIPHVWHVREMLYKDYNLVYPNKKIVMKLFEKAESVIAISEFIKSSRDILNKNLRVISDGVDSSLYYDEFSEARYSSDFVNIIYVGHTSKEKGIEDIVGLMDELVNNRAITNVKLVVAGGVHSDFKELLEKKPSIVDYIECLGVVNGLKKIRHSANISLMCSRNEALGRTTIEAMLAGTFVIGADAGATPEIIDNGVNGLLYELGDIEKLADCVEYYINNKETVIKMIRKGQEQAVQEYDSLVYAKTIEKVYEECLKK